MADEIKARHQRAGFLWKLPMSKCVSRLSACPVRHTQRRSSHTRCSPIPPSPPPARALAGSTTWSKRFFVAKDGFLLYYSTGSPTQSFFDTKPKVRYAHLRMASSAHCIGSES